MTSSTPPGQSDRERPPHDPVDVRTLALLFAIVVAGAVVVVAYKDPALGGAIAVGITVLVAVLVILRSGTGGGS
ncbi:hypothetical protein [Streptodolium elevatio]|uniref:Uncharacterized protein n=1 Tax=Streptodolium elevatio TaxID=3157996 RepID=A0ABV3DWM1_9ACTN